MKLELLDAFDRGLAEFDDRVHRVRNDQWDGGTPCTSWSVRDLVNHLTGEHLWAPWLLRGATLEEVGDRFDGDVLGDHPVRAWERAAADSRDAFHEPGALDGTVHTSGGPTPAAEYARQMVMDLTVHAWDLARGVGADDGIDGDLVALVYDYTRELPGALQGAFFAAPVRVPASASRQDQLLGLLGRDPGGGAAAGRGTAA
ncbi:TIGR03086 family metal-binding protein [Streptomyces sp. B6B3]|uniref:TIGR03086 family metal-binding protein n=1 Tax=Streptomyces sp. B6B3 TaxID=3153570 RepID=UPI00325F2AE8